MASLFENFSTTLLSFGNKIIKTFFSSTKDKSQSQFFPELFEQQARKTPKATAVICGGESLTYEALNSKSTQLALYLQKLGVRSDVLVAVCMDRSLDMIVTLIGIMKAGGAYVPLDSNFPIDRLGYMIDDSKVSIIMTHSTLLKKLPILSQKTKTTISLDLEWYHIQKTAENVNKQLREDIDPGDLAYVIYTSGSTGRPKGVMITHCALANFLISMQKKPRLSASDKWLAITTFCFDIAALELYLPLLVGAQCYICSTETVKNIEQLMLEIEQVKPTIMQATPTTWNMLFQAGWRNKEKLRILCGGEALSESLKNKFLSSKSEAWNLYGPTETTIWSTINLISSAGSPHNIGKPIANTDVYILSESQEILPIGSVGELCIAGKGVARGYLNKPELNKDKFITCDFDPSLRLYRTGDLGRWCDNGTIEFLGRIDHQVKIRGFRIELTEIDTVLDNYPGIQTSICIVKELRGQEQLLSYYVTSPEISMPLDVLDIRKHLSNKLPDYMIPALFIKIDKLPLTLNGKVDRKLLRDRAIEPELASINRVSISPVLAQVSQLWTDILNIENIDMHASFFDMGGNSVLGMALVKTIMEKIHPNFSITTLFEHNTIAKLSRYIEESQNIKRPVIEPLMRGNEYSVVNKQENTHFSENQYSDIAIVGMAGKFPEANDLEEFWDNIIEGKNCLTTIPGDRWSWQKVYGDVTKDDNKTSITWGGFISGIKAFDPLFFGISPREAELMDPQQRLLMTYTWLALENAGIPPAVFAEKKTGVFIAASPNQYHSLIPGTPENNPYILTSSILSMIPNRISHVFDFCGPSELCEVTCSSSLVAIHRAIQSIHRGECEQVIVGAVNLLLSPREHIAYESMGLLSTSSSILSFQEKADGYARGEGIGVLILKPLKLATENRDIIHAVIKGSGVCHGGKGMSLTAPNENGMRVAMMDAYKMASIHPQTVGYIEAHGTAAPIGDRIEVHALKSAFHSLSAHFGPLPIENKCYLGSLKPSIGHCEIAAGMAALIKVVKALQHKTIPGLPNFTTLNEDISLIDSPFHMTKENNMWDFVTDIDGKALPRRASVNSYGFGVNAHIVVEEYI